VLSVDNKAIQRWSTTTVPASKRLDYFAAALSEAINPIGICKADPRSFHADLSFANLGDIGVTKVAGGAHGSFRGSAELALSNEHKFNLLMSLTSPWTAEHRGALRMTPRDVLVVDSESPIRTDVRIAFTAINVAVSASWLRQWVPDPHVLAARRIRGDSLWGLTLSSYLSELSPELAAAPPLPLSVIADQVGALLALTAGNMRNSLKARSVATRALQERIEDCIAQRCTELHLTAADVAAATQVSVRTLHRTLAAANQTFGGRLIEARAGVAMRMLTSPLFRRVLTAEIGHRAGFTSPSHFARVIRLRFGRTPRQLRAAAGAGAVHEQSLGALNAETGKLKQDPR
jgi:AraC family transcriptional activator of tynA and feaB